MRVKVALSLLFIFVSTGCIWFYHQDEVGESILDDSLTVLAPAERAQSLDELGFVWRLK